MNIDDQFFKEFCELDLHYYVILAHMNLVTFVFKTDKTKDLIKKLHSNFVNLIFSIVKNKMMQITDHLHFDVFYNTFSKEERLKIKKLISSNIDIFEILFASLVYETIDQMIHIDHNKRTVAKTHQKQ